MKTKPGVLLYIRFFLVTSEVVLCLHLTCSVLNIHPKTWGKNITSGLESQTESNTGFERSALSIFFLSFLHLASV